MIDFGHGDEQHIPHGTHLGEDGVLANLRLAGHIGHDAEDDLTLTAERRQVALRQHGAHAIPQEVVDIFPAPHDEAEGKDISIRIACPKGLAALLAQGVLVRAEVDECLHLITYRQGVVQNQMAQLVEQPQPQQADPKLDQERRWRPLWHSQSGSAGSPD